MFSGGYGVQVRHHVRRGQAAQSLANRRLKAVEFQVCRDSLACAWLTPFREMPKRPTEIKLTRDGQTILVSDKFGDIFRYESLTYALIDLLILAWFSYPFHPEPLPSPTAPAGTSKRDALTSHENPSNGTLILGHTSLLTAFVLTEDEKFLISADRDEHVRVSWYPQGYVIERYCLGHEK